MNLSIIQLSGIVSASTMTALMIWSVLIDRFRFWPPGERNLRWFTYWTLATVNTLSIVAIILQSFSFSSLGFYRLFTLLLIFVGVLISAKAIRTLGAEQTSGIDGELVNNGLYSYSRNPQVVGNLISVVGFVLYTSTTASMVIGVLASTWLISMVFSEEKKLKEDLGISYKEYLEEVPRFI